MTEIKKKKMGRPPKENPKKNLWSIRFDDEKNALLERLVRLWSNEGESKSETLERVIVYALKIFFNAKKREFERESERTEKAINKWGLSLAPPNRPLRVKAVDVPATPSPSPSPSTDPTANGGAVDVPASVSVSPSPLSSVDPTANGGAADVSAVRSVPSSLGSWFDEGGKNG